ncbi:mechanosensitive ion channel family protein [Haloferax sp. Atlit-10N]|uniref:mechanosensitive ion channel family protein n=1 Tax=Haloferax TaxID=2251 RepID=UPI0006793E80|nr:MULTISPECIES: mechanosensitive ion channel family protein [Haloferax]RDZ44042.1 mechanosensitive ion channel family protein [Haloferax sp. Atlit-16N]RDZ47530.1 mechanosensitive ion channel family protein [Haloferax sp. Atlit-19N]RDZ58086.1 mechanosensitive ion channel family protein [Haloferax sp. Atlit-10N]
MAPQGGAAVQGQATTWLQDLRSALAQFVSTEERLGISAALVALALGVAVFLAPRLVSRATAEFRTRVLAHPRVPDAVTDAAWLFPATVVVRTLQLAVFVGVALSLLLLWGYTGLAADFAEVLAVAIPNAAKLGATVALFAGALVGTNVLEEKLDSYATASDNINAHQQGIVFRVLQLVVLLAVGMAALTVWQVRIGGLLVGAGFLGIVVGMAARQTLGSLIAGFVLMFSRPFELGDWVEIDDAEGIVTDITIINTRLSNADGETVVFPNDRVTNAKITNRTKRNRLRLRLDVGIDYEADIEHAESVAEEALTDLKFVEDVPKPQVMPTTFGDSSIGLQLRFWITNPSAPRRAQAKAEVLRSVKLAFDREGIKIPYPQRELLAREEADGFQLREARRSRPVEKSVSKE